MKELEEKEEIIKKIKIKKRSCERLLKKKKNDSRKQKTLICNNKYLYLFLILFFKDSSKLNFSHKK
jgi:hypothetical protein